MISDDDIAGVLPARVAELRREPYEYATSFALERVRARLTDGRELDLILKDLRWESLLPDARASKPDFVYEPLREIDTYRRVLPLVNAGPNFYGSGDDWLLIEKVGGVELWQIGDSALWDDALRWTAAFHRRAAEVDAAASNPFLLRYDAALIGGWAPRALEATGDTRLARVVDRYSSVIDALISLPASFIHGELYPSNVLIGDHPVPIDWEMAAIGTPLLDVVALTSGWPDARRDELVAAYVAAAGDAPWISSDLDHMLDCCRLHYAMQWLGWSAGWTPPREHLRDWLQEALHAADRLGL
jgi:hypothetical protein